MPGFFTAKLLSYSLHLASFFATISQVRKYGEQRIIASYTRKVGAFVKTTVGSAAERIAHHRALPRRPFDHRPLVVRVAQGLCDDGFSREEAIKALQAASVEATLALFLDQHALLVWVKGSKEKTLMCWIPAPGGVFRYDPPPRSGKIYEDSFSKSFEPAVIREFGESLDSLVGHIIDGVRS